MDLAKRDILINALKKEKREKIQVLKDNKIQLSKCKNDNRHLNVVVEDYNDYFSLLQQEKDKQKEALQLLLNHLTKIIMDTTTSSDMIKQAKHDKSIILSELKHLL